MSEETSTVTLSPEVQSIIDSVKTLSVLQLSELVKGLEETFGVTAAAPMMMGAMPMMAGGGGGGAAAPAEEAPTSFDVILKEHGANKINVIKEVRAITGLGLKEAKDLVDGAPKPIKTGVDKDEADKIKAQVEPAGAVIEIKPAA